MVSDADAVNPSTGPSSGDRAQGVPQLRTILLTDLVDSTELVEGLGDGPASELFRAHDRLVLQLQQRWRGRLIDRSDGLLLLFERPIDGLGFALDYRRGLQSLGAPLGVDLKARAGLHVGEVLSWRNSDEAVRVGAKPLEVEGLAKPMAARLMATAQPGQILLSAVAEPLAHRAARELGERGLHLVWKSHGRWRFKGVGEPQEVFEVGEPGLATLRAPASSAKAWRDIPLWRRPAALAVQLVLLLAVVGTAWFASRPQPAIAFAERDWVVLADLRNLTGESLLDDSLEQAFRISLEQSRHVNVLSDLKTRDTLARMQREPDTELNRTVASEIAIRDGARAVILPTVAEVGGRVRVSAEVIDPHSQTTVYSQYADGRGVESVLASIDDVTATMRAKLGEAIAEVDSHSLPLPKVATDDLDALRAYALGLDAYSRGQFDSAKNHFTRAIERDSNFALAYLGILRVHVTNVDAPAARTYLEQAQRLRDHLPPRDALYLDAWAAEFGEQPSVEAPPRWKMLFEAYPDYFSGYQNYAWHMFNAGHYAVAEQALEHAIVAPNPLSHYCTALQGRIQLATGRQAEALDSFRRAASMSQTPLDRRAAGAFAAMGTFDVARDVLDQAPEAEVLPYFERIAIALDQRKYREAEELVGRASGDASGLSNLIRYPLDINRLLIMNIREPGSVSVRQLGDLAGEIIDDATAASGGDKDDLVIMALAAVRLSQRLNGRAVALEHLPAVEKLVISSGHRGARTLLEVAKAEQLSLAGDPDAAADRLLALIDGSEPFQTHVALRDALQAAGREREAALQDDWLLAHRGLAYSEPIGGQVFLAMNVADAARPKAGGPAARPGG